MFTAIFISVIVHTKYPVTTSTKDGVLGTLAIAITLATVAGMVGASSGGCFNPTIGLTETTIMMAINPTLEGQYFKYSVVYIFGPLFGGILAAFYTYYIAFRVPVGKDYVIIEGANSINNRTTKSEEIKDDKDDTYKSTV